MKTRVMIPAARRPGGRPDKRHRVAGQALPEYLMLGLLIAIVLVIGEPSPLEELFRAIQSHYGRFTMALSLP